MKKMVGTLLVMVLAGLILVGDTQYSAGAEATYVGAAKCGECHVTEYRGWSKTPHGQAKGYGEKIPGFVDTSISCEFCHGPGSKHVESMDKADVIVYADLSHEEKIKLCGQCHGKSATHAAKAAAGEEYEEFLNSKHNIEGQINCTTCHTTHGLVKGVQLVAEFDKLCAKCHKDQKFELDKVMPPKAANGTTHIRRDHSFKQK